MFVYLFGIKGNLYLWLNTNPFHYVCDPDPPLTGKLALTQHGAT